MLKKVEVVIDIPDGYKFVRYGIPELGEQYLASYPVSHVLSYDSSHLSCEKRFIVNQKELRSPVLPNDSGKDARFSQDGKRWVAGKLVGWADGSYGWKDDLGMWWKFCQVSDD